MKSIKVFAIAIGVCIMLTASIRINQNKPDEIKSTMNKQGFAVLELFTSEGCSSCPPAETVLKEIQQEYKGKPVYILAFHVDYWNHLGWRDQFSQEAFTERQRQYVYTLGSGSLYTPQLVINGAKEFVGSSKRAIIEEIDANLSAPTKALELNCSLNQNKLTIKYEGTPNKQSELVLALIQKTAQSNVKAGENSGRDLSHIQVVRILERFPFDPSRAITMTVPANFTAKDWELIGFVQRKSNGHTELAGRFDFNSLR
jgi:hypothetical protein